jgi:hypothetical protein
MLVFWSLVMIEKDLEVEIVKKERSIIDVPIWVEMLGSCMWCSLDNPIDDLG